MGKRENEQVAATIISKSTSQDRVPIHGSESDYNGEPLPPKNFLPELLETAGQRALTPDEIQLLSRLIEEYSLTAWKEFTARIVHVLGTRVAVISAILSQLRHNFSIEEERNINNLREVQMFIENMGEGIQKLQVTLKDMRAFATPLMIRSDQIDLVEVLRSTLQETPHSTNCTIELILPDTPLKLNGDGMMLSNAFMELIQNSREAMQQDTGRVQRITISLSSPEPHAKCGVMAQIEFVDTGPGISSSMKKRLFEPFFSTKGKHSGLGMSIVKAIIEKHGGTIEELGVLGEGARFIICLPTIG